MHAKTATRPKAAAPRSDLADMGQVRDAMAGLLLEAARFVAPDRVEALAWGWLARAEPSQTDPGREVLQAADALGMAMDLALFTPSAGGATAFDRLARARHPGGPSEAAALEALRRAQFRLLRVEAVSGEGARLRDLASGEELAVLDETIPAEAVGVALVGRVAPLGDGRHAFAGGVIPLDEAALGVAMGFVRPGAGRGLVNPQRCAEAVYRHVLRHGTLEIPGLNRPPEDEADELLEEGGALDQLAQRWAEPGAAHDPEDIQFVREQTSLDGVLDLLASVAHTREHGLGALSGGYAAIALLQLETLHRRSVAGSGAVGLDTVAAAVNAAIAAGEMPEAARTVFSELRGRLGAAPSGAGAKDAELDRLIGRIQALRAKTVEQGCTEQEALAAAEKVAELLDRYGLSLSELDLKRQACEGAAVETQRRRTGPVDDCVPTVAAFFDCRVWAETSASGTLRHVFFGLPADVAAARYLYDLVERAFETETARFRAGPDYAEAPTRLRRTLTNSFQIGLGRGVTAKLHSLREAREAALRASSGRDLVVAKADVVEEELAKLGLHLRARSRTGGRRVLRDAFEAGHEAGLGFEYTPGVTHQER
ncbi:MAG: DUF2786 domain-containing protein [Acetobacteraceae bacterium]|nr:DUF2786 domain-containing protein [Acetobacteraceae bacterium]